MTFNLIFKIATVFFSFILVSALTQAGEFITLQSTTSTQNAGLYDFMLPKFEADTGIKVHVVSVGTGQALKNSQNGDGDVLLVHDKQSELEFIRQGFGVERFDLMFNDFVLVGPMTSNLIAPSNDITNALNTIATSPSLFVSRGDDSGTHKKEQALWKLAGINIQKASGQWYRKTGSSMGATLNTAVAMNAFTLTDRATWIGYQNKQDFKIWVEKHPVLFNQYGVIIVNPKKHPHVKIKLAKRFVSWLLSPKGQQVIAEYEQDNQQLFFPNATIP